MAAEVIAVVVGRIMAPNIFRESVDLQAIAIRALVVGKFFAGSEHHLPDPQTAVERTPTDSANSDRPGIFASPETFD